ncbi:MAG: LuxR C-terminal-related transcriptional regulator [Solirubrobacteraceae bacterium]
MYAARVSVDSAAEGVLSARQLEVLALVARGRSTEGIAVELFLSPNTVRSHVRNILDNLGARNRPHAVAIAFAAGLIRIDEVRMADGVRSD